MNKKLTDDQIIAARDMRSRGMSWAAIGKATGVTAEAARQAVKRLESAPPPTSDETEAEVPEAVRDEIIANAEASLADEGTDEGMLDALVRDVRAIQKTAKDDAKRLQCIRLLNSIVAQRAKLRPEPPPDPNANPLVRLRAEQCIKKLRELLERV